MIDNYLALTVIKVMQPLTKNEKLLLKQFKVKCA